MTGGQSSVMAVRRRLWASGYRPVAVYGWQVEVNSPGKQPVGSGWQDRARRDPPEASTAIPRLDALNTGVLCDGLRAIDIDLDDPSLADDVEKLAFEMLGQAPVRWRADSARRLILYRAAEGEPGKRILPGSYGNIEALGRGQQFVAYGTHPSGARYEWRPGDPAPYHRDALNAATEAQIDAFLASAAPLIGANPPRLPKAKSGTTANGIHAPFVEFEWGTISITADQAIGQADRNEDRSAIDEAKEFLKRELADGAVSSKLLLTHAKELGISEKTARRAAKAIGVLIRKEGFTDGWGWSFPIAPNGFQNRFAAPKMANLSQDGHAENMGIFETFWPPSASKEDRR